jgi:malonyl-CoA O-methyltransferase
MPQRIPPSISAQFSKAATQYDQHAPIQQQVANDLWAWAQPLLPNPFTPQHCVDVGCGTGFLTQHLLSHYPNTPVHAVDMAQGMLNTVQNKHPSPHLHTHQLNGETLTPEQLRTQTPCLLASSMCAQWFQNLDQALHHWLNTANIVVFSVLLHPSFDAWRQAHTQAQQPCGLRQLPTHEHILSLIEQCQAQGLLHQHKHLQGTYLEHHPDGLSFARSLRAIGAHTPHPAHKPANLRPVLAQLKNGCTLNYQLGFYCLERS